jgi:long-chain acyl-CoA synthetase
MIRVFEWEAREEKLTMGTNVRELTRTGSHGVDLQTVNLGDWLHASAERNARKPALICGDQTKTYAEFDRDVESVARWLLRQGLEPGDRVAVHWTNSIPAATLMLGCLRLGMIAVPVNVRLKPLEIGYVLGHSEAKLCFSQPELAPLAEQGAAECGSLRRIYTEIPAEAYTATGGSLPEVAEDAPGLILYTSGTTARPKGVTETHRNLYHAAELMWRVGLDGGETFLVMTSMMHASGISFQLLPALLAGATLAMVPVFQPAAVLDAIERHGCTVCLAFPSMMLALCEEQAVRPRDTSSLRAAMSGGDTVPVSVQERFRERFGVAVQEVLGMTETNLSFCNPRDAIRPGSAGREVEGVEARVLDFSGNDLPDGEIGELAIRSAANFSHYWNDPRETANVWRDGWLLTGDLVRRDADSYMWFEGRKKEIIIRCGSNISPQEVEEALYHHPAVLEVGVIGMPHPVLREQVVACVSLREEQKCTEEELIAFARTRLADYKSPERIVFLAELPKGLTGKVHRRTLKELAAVQAGATHA